MSVEAFDRAIARETFWEPFVYSFSYDINQTAERVIVFGLYSGSYLNQIGYLQEIESEDLSNLLNDYNAKLAELAMREQLVLADIMAKRYLAGIDKLIHDAKMVTKQGQLDAESAEWDAKMEALSTDRAALVTLQSKVTAETAAMVAKIANLEAYIANENYNLTAVDIEIAEKEIQRAKLEIAKLDTQHEILKLQLQVVEAGIGLVNVDEEIARTKISIANINKEEAKMALYPIELQIEQTKTEMARAELPMSAARLELAQAQGTELDSEVTYTNNTLINQENVRHANKDSMQDLQYHIKMSDLEHAYDEEKQAIEDDEKQKTLALWQAQQDHLAQPILDKYRIGTLDNSARNYADISDATIEAAKKLVLAKIATTLTHTIQKAQ